MSDFDFQRPRMRKPRSGSSNKTPVLIIGVLAILLLAGGGVAAWLAMRTPATAVVQTDGGATQRAPATQRNTQPTQRVTPTQRQPDPVASKVKADPKWKAKGERELAKLTGDDLAIARKLFALVGNEELKIRDLSSQELHALKHKFGDWLLTPWLATKVIEDAGQGAADLCSALHISDVNICKQVAYAYWHYDGEDKKLLDDLAAEAKAKGDPSKVDPAYFTKLKQPQFKLFRSALQ